MIVVEPPRCVTPMTNLMIQQLCKLLDSMLTEERGITDAAVLEAIFLLATTRSLGGGLPSGRVQFDKFKKVSGLTVGNNDNDVGGRAPRLAADAPRSPSTSTRSAAGRSARCRRTCRRPTASSSIMVPTLDTVRSMWPSTRWWPSRAPCSSSARAAPPRPPSSPSTWARATPDAYTSPRSTSRRGPRRWTSRSPSRTIEKAQGHRPARRQAAARLHRRPQHAACRHVRHAAADRAAQVRHRQGLPLRPRQGPDDNHQGHAVRRRDGPRLQRRRPALRAFFNTAPSPSCRRSRSSVSTRPSCRPSSTRAPSRPTCRA